MIIFYENQDYTAEEFLIVYDYEFKYGQNFFITVSEDARDMFAKVIE